MASTGIGASVLRREDQRLLTGSGQYTDDIAVAGQTYAIFVRSTHAHADLLDVDIQRAKALAGVVGVFTGRDLLAAGVAPIPTLFAERGAGMQCIDGTPFAEPVWHVLATDRVRHVGEPIAIIIAESLAIAQDAADEVVVRYAERPVVIDAKTALAPEATPLHASVPVKNRAYDWQCGDVDATARGFQHAAHVTRIRLIDNRLVTCFMEPRAAIAIWDAGAARLTLHAGLQSVHALADSLARILRLRTDQVRCLSGDVGGGFGTKIQAYPEYAAIAWAARQLGRPVRWTSTRSEGFVSDAHSRDHQIDAELALDANGRILALRAHSVTDLGAYLAPCIPVSTLSNMQRLISGVYAIPAIHLRVTGAFTNTVPVNVYRGVGRFESVYTTERLIEQAALETGRDATALRRLNMVPASAFPYRTATGALYDSGDFVARMEEAVMLGDRAGLPARREESKQRGRLRGIAFGPYIEGTGGAPQEFAEVRVLPNGTVEVPVGSHSQGQSHETVFAQVVAERLGVPYEAVRMVMGDTDKVAQGIGTFASRSMVRAGNAMAEVVDLAIAKGKQMAAHVMETSVADIDYADGAFRVAGTDRRIGLFELARAAAAGELPPSFAGTLGAAKMHENPAFAFANGCEACEVEVDPETGAVTIVALAVVDDSGRAVNPMVVHGQMHGAVVQGLGQAMFEHTVYDRATGQLLSGSFMDYAIPRADEVPSIPIVSRDMPSPSNLLGVKGAGEGGTVGAPGALIHAILDALAPLGVKHLDMPATPERVWQAIERARSFAPQGSAKSMNHPRSTS
jgi:aerobic carbon-monoxide dehydrogenase large subunit